MSKTKAKIAPFTPAEEARIMEGIVDDRDAPEITDEQWAKAKPFAEVFPEIAERMRRSRGRPRVESPKEKVTIRLDADVLEKLRASGPGWQRRINDQLRRELGLA